MGQVLLHELAFFQWRADAELRLRALQIITEATLEEAEEMGAHLRPLPSMHILIWDERAAESTDPLMVARWGCFKDARPRIPWSDDLVPSPGPSTVLKLGW